MGINQSVSTITQVPGSLIAGFIFEYAGIVPSFFLGAILLIVAFGLSIRVHYQVKTAIPL